MTVYLKVTNKDECYDGYQYHDGLNVWPVGLYDNPKGCSGGGFYFTTKENIHQFYQTGINVRIITLPVENPDFRMETMGSGSMCWANMIVLGEKYSLDDIKTYWKLDIKIPTFEHAVIFDYRKLAKYLFFCTEIPNIDKDSSILSAIYNDNMEMVEILHNAGAKINIDYMRFVGVKVFENNPQMVKFAVEHSIFNQEKLTHVTYGAIDYGNIGIVKYLLENGAIIKLDNMTVSRIINKNYFDLLKYLVGYGHNQFDLNDALNYAVMCNKLEMAKYFLELGADIHTGNDSPLMYAINCEQWHMVSFLLEKGANVGNLSESLQKKLREKLTN